MPWQPRQVDARLAPLCALPAAAACGCCAKAVAAASDPRPIATPTLRAVAATRMLELTRERNQRPAIVISGPVRKIAAHLIGPAASGASQAEPAKHGARGLTRRRGTPRGIS